MVCSANRVRVHCTLYPFLHKGLYVVRSSDKESVTENIDDMIRYDQRQHIIRSLDQAIYQLYTISFFLSPSLLSFICRVMFQFQFSRPRELDPNRSLRFWFFLILLFNSGSIWNNATIGAVQGRSVVLDFIGPSHVPSKVQLLSLDFIIIFLNIILTTVAYETTLYELRLSDTPDPLLPIPSPTPSAIATPLPEDASSSPPLPIPSFLGSKPSSEDIESHYVLDLRPQTIIDRLRGPTPPSPEDELRGREILPLPNTAAASQLRTTLQLLLAARRRARVRSEEQEQTETRLEGDREGSRREQRRVPGGLETEDGT